MKALVISGGGSKGAFAGGVAEFLIKECNKQYDLLVGTSTGSLLIPLLSIGKVEKLKKIFTSVTQDEIFDICPFIINKRNGVYRTRINHWGIIRMFLKGKKTFGESRNLRMLIGRTLSTQDFDEIKKNGVDVIATVANLCTNKVEYKSVRDFTYDEFCDWLWASANVVPFMSLFEKDGIQYADGGIGSIIPIYHAINKGACEIDIIVLNPDKVKPKKLPISNAMELITRVFDFMVNQIRTDDVMIGKLQGLKHNVDLNFYFCPEILTDNSLIFDPESMKNWWEYGLSFARNNSPLCKCIKASA